MGTYLPYSTYRYITKRRTLSTTQKQRIFFPHPLFVTFYIQYYTWESCRTSGFLVRTQSDLGCNQQGRTRDPLPPISLDYRIELVKINFPYQIAWISVFQTLYTVKRFREKWSRQLFRRDSYQFPNLYLYYVMLLQKNNTSCGGGKKWTRLSAGESESSNGGSKIAEFIYTQLSLATAHCQINFKQ